MESVPQRFGEDFRRAVLWVKSFSTSITSMLSILRPLQGFSLFKYLTRTPASGTQSMSIYDLTVTNVDGEPFALEQFKGKARFPPVIVLLSPL